MTSHKIRHGSGKKKSKDKKLESQDKSVKTNHPYWEEFEYQRQLVNYYQRRGLPCFYFIEPKFFVGQGQVSVRSAGILAPAVQGTNFSKIPIS